MSDCTDHSHGAGHSHAPSPHALASDPRAKRALLIALIVGAIFFVIEVIGGLLTSSLALLGDAAHMFTDVLAYALALWAAVVAQRPAAGRSTFGSGRVEILAALINGATLLAGSAWISFEAVRRLGTPTEVAGGEMTVVAIAGLIANVVVLSVLWRAGSMSLNMRGAVLHAAGDLLGSIAAVSAGLVVWLTGYNQADAIASLALVLLIAIGAWRLVRESVDILLNLAPVDQDPAEIGERLANTDDVVEVHDLHLWTMSPGTVSFSAHIRVRPSSDHSAVLARLQRLLLHDYGINHSTLQLTVDRGSLPIETVPTMTLDEAIDWATNEVASARPDLSKAVISAAAGAAALGIATTDGRVSPITVSTKTLTLLRDKAQ